jgi:wobble nucleotide-excising tRNase
MLIKITCIKNIGLFRDANHSSHDFAKVTLIYAENGRGKSTLASIFRSCSTNDAKIIHRRRTLDCADSPVVGLIFKTDKKINPATFEDNKWSPCYPDILLFDTDFVDKNVYSGTVINASHREGLLEFALGESAVNLKQKIDDEAKLVSDKNQEITSIEKELKSYRGGLEISVFSKLEVNSDVDEQIEKLETLLNTARDNVNIQKKSYPEILIKPQLDLDSFFEILSKTLEDIEKNAEYIVNQHITNHSTPGFGEWLGQGQLSLDNSNCPYCGQDITSNQLVTAYKTYFNQAYKDMKSDFIKLIENIKIAFGDSNANKIFAGAGKNDYLYKDWQNYISLEEIGLDENLLSNSFKNIHDTLDGLFRVKQQNLFEATNNDTEREQAELLRDKIFLEIERYNNLVHNSIDKIKAFKENLASESIQKIQSDIEMLKLIKKRQEPNTCALIDSWSTAKAAKQEHENRKKAFRNELDQLMNQTLEQYQEKINEIVGKFGALFRIDKLVHDYKGTGTARSNYGLKVKGESVELSADDAPSFSNALSEGDKRTLAFAFFVARIEADANIGNKIVVVDDPVCSLDRSRRNHTKTILLDISTRSAQLIVLGHDAYFLRDLRDDLHKYHKLPIHLAKLIRSRNDNTDFDQLDLEKECASKYYSSYKTLESFTKGNTTNDLYSVGRSIRPLLEGYLHRRFPGHIKKSTLVGKIVGEVNAAVLPNPLAYLQSLTSEITQVNDYAGKFHHDASSSDSQDSIDESELLSYARRALTIIHKGTI